MRRRQFLGKSAQALSSLALSGLFIPRVFNSRALAQNALGANRKKKLIYIFQRGGNDGLNTLIPRGDQNYNTGLRPTLFIPETAGIDTGNGFAQLHPSFAPMMEVYNHTSINGLSGLGNVAMIHRVGYRGQTRSHFDSQQYWENGSPGSPNMNVGMLYRRLDNALDLTSQENPLVAASISGSQLVALRGPKPLPNFERASDFSFPGSAVKKHKFLGRIPNRETGDLGSGFLGAYGAIAPMYMKKHQSLVGGTGVLLGATMETLEQAVAQGTYTPVAGANYPPGRFGSKLMEAAMLMKRTDIQVVGMNIGGWDTHTSQGQQTGSHPLLLQYIAQAVQALSVDLEDQWEDLIVVTLSEFGRTSMENGSRGTDHAEAGVMMLAGGNVNGGIYNCDRTSWEDDAIFQVNGRYLSHRTDYRAIFAEIFTRHFGDSSAALDSIIPGYNDAVRMDADKFKFLDFLSAPALG